MHLPWLKRSIAPPLLVGSSRNFIHFGIYLHGCFCAMSDFAVHPNLGGGYPSSLGIDWKDELKRRGCEDRALLSLVERAQQLSQQAYPLRPGYHEIERQGSSGADGNSKEAITNLPPFEEPLEVDIRSILPPAGISNQDIQMCIEYIQWKIPHLEIEIQYLRHKGQILMHTQRRQGTQDEALVAMNTETGPSDPTTSIISSASPMIKYKCKICEVIVWWRASEGNYKCWKCGARTLYKIRPQK